MDDLKLHPLTGEPLLPLGTFKGRPVWPILGAADDDEGDDDSGSDDDGSNDEGDDDSGSDESDDTSDDSDDDGESDEDEPDDKPKGKAKGGDDRKGKGGNSRPDPRESELPAWARDKIANLRSEAAGHRKKAAEYRPKAQDADRYRAALATGLSERQARRLTGKTYDEILEDARELRKELGLDKGDEDNGGKGKGGSNGGQRRRRDATGGDGRGGSDTLEGKSSDELYQLARSGR